MTTVTTTLISKPRLSHCSGTWFNQVPNDLGVRFTYVFQKNRVITIAYRWHQNFVEYATSTWKSDTVTQVKEKGNSWCRKTEKNKAIRNLKASSILDLEPNESVTYKEVEKKVREQVNTELNTKLESM